MLQFSDKNAFEKNANQTFQQSFLKGTLVDLPKHATLSLNGSESSQDVQESDKPSNSKSNFIANDIRSRAPNLNTLFDAGLHRHRNLVCLVLVLSGARGFELLCVELFCVM